MDPIIHLVTNKLRLRQDTAAGKVYLERFENGVWVTRAEVDATAGEAGWAKYLGLTAAELQAIQEPEGATHGDILFRGATAWTRLPAGQAGYFLKTQGPGADPVWAEPPAGGAGARTATVIVAAADSSARSKQGADYVVPEGLTSAQTVVNQAIGDLPPFGGKVVVLEGTYIVDGSILAPSNVEIEIVKGATIKVKDGAPATIYIIQNADQVNGNTNIRVTGAGKLDGNKANQTTAETFGVRFVKVTDASVSGLIMTGFTDEGVSLDSCERVVVRGNVFTDSAYGVYTYNYIRRCVFAENIALGITSIPLYLDYTEYCLVAGNVVVGSGSHGIGIYDDVGSVLVANQCLQNTSSGMRIYRGYETVIANNMCVANGMYGISVDTSSYRVSVIGNYVRQNSRHGIRCYSWVTHSIIANNFCSDNGQAANNTYDNINLSFNCDNNLIQGNKCHKGTLINLPRYGIRIDTVDCDKNLVINNDCLDGGATNGISDAGTNTNFGPGNRINDGTWSTTPG